MKNKSKEISYLLRHKPEGLDMNEYGWVFIDKLLDKLKITRSELEKIVAENNKQRFTISEDGLKIKANQGHSIDIKLELEPIEPPEVLYHGTSMSHYKEIEKSGLKKMQRHHVHMTESFSTAVDVGLRYAKNRSNLCILRINSQQMYIDGIDFYKTENNVWLTDYVDKKYFI